VLCSFDQNPPKRKLGKSCSLRERKKKTVFCERKEKILQEKKREEKDPPLKQKGVAWGKTSDFLLAEGEAGVRGRLGGRAGAGAGEAARLKRERGDRVASALQKKSRKDIAKN